MRNFLMIFGAAALLTLPAYAQEVVVDTNVIDKGEDVVIVDEDAAPEEPVAVVEETTDWEEMQKMSDLSLFNEALVSTDLYRLLESGQPYTIFAPTNTAMRRIPPQEKKRLNNPEHRNLLKKTIAYHISPGLHPASDFKTGKNRLSTLEGAKLTIEAGANNIYAENAKLIKRDIELTHIIVHKIDAVLTEAE